MKKLLEEAKNFAKKAQKFIDNFKSSGKADQAALKNLFKECIKMLADHLNADVITDIQYMNYSNIAITAYVSLKNETTLSQENHDHFTAVINNMIAEIEAIEKTA